MVFVAGVERFVAERACAALAAVICGVMLACDPRPPPRAAVSLPARASASPPATYAASFTRVVARSTPFETPVYIVDSGEAGPSVLIVAGIHGDEKAPPIAARRIATWTLKRGRIIVIPEANRPALRAGTRHTPQKPPSDLNREFPTAEDAEPQGAMARIVWELIREERIDWVLDLHEGWDFHLQNPKSVGSTVVIVPDTPTEARARAMAEAVVEALNANVERPLRRFTVHSPGPKGSLARSASEARAVPSLVIETTRLGQPVDLRVEQHEQAVRVVLAQLQLL